MQMELDPLVLGRGFIRAETLLRLHDVARIEDHVVIELGIVYFTLNEQMIPDADAAQDRLVILGTQIA